jgi:Secretion system C-terminal sorting domain
VTVTDGEGDGLSAFNPGGDFNHPFPGIEFVAEDGKVLKPVLDSEIYFEKEAKSYLSVDLTSSLSDQDFVQNLNIFPNPVHDILNIDLDIKTGIDYEIFVSDILGAQLTKVAKNTNYLPVDHLNSGIYFLNVKTKDGLFTHKFNKI